MIGIMIGVVSVTTLMSSISIPMMTRKMLIIPMMTHLLVETE